LSTTFNRTVLVFLIHVPEEVVPLEATCSFKSELDENALLYKNTQWDIHVDFEIFF